MEQDQNKKHHNHIYIVAGEHKFRKDFVTQDKHYNHDPNINAFIYKYEPDSQLFSKNGDIGIVIFQKQLQLSFTNGMVALCLPNVYENILPDNMKVTIAGWGKRHYEGAEINGGVGLWKSGASTCQTNEAMTHPDQRFLECMSDPSHTKSQTRQFCATMPDQVAITLQTNYRITFSTNTGVIFKNYEFVFDKKHIKEDTMCMEYWDRIVTYFATLPGDSPVNMEIFNRRTDRFVILSGKAPHQTLATCFNFQKAGRYGICPTGHPINSWGFCSRSCGVTPWPKTGEIYEETEMFYHDETPRNAGFEQQVIYY